MSSSKARGADKRSRTAKERANVSPSSRPRRGADAASKRSVQGGEASSSGRVGARSPAEVPPEILRQLNAGSLETATLAEALAIDLVALLDAVAPEVGLSHARAGLVAEARAQSQEGYARRIAAIGRALAGAAREGPDGRALLERLAGHGSDTVRSFAAYATVEFVGEDLPTRLQAVRRFAADRHFGVREWAWMSVRPSIILAPDRALLSLLPWTSERDPNLRRFAVEATRPRGVWCSHIEAFKREPERALPLIEPLNADPARYVQDAVANWLNDASKSQPQWVQQVCKSWRKQSSSPATDYIVRRALRTVETRRRS